MRLLALPDHVVDKLMQRPCILGAVELPQIMCLYSVPYGRLDMARS